MKPVNFGLISLLKILGVLTIIVSLWGGCRFIIWLQCYLYTGESKSCKVMVLNGGSLYIPYSDIFNKLLKGEDNGD